MSFFLSLVFRFQESGKFSEEQENRKEEVWIGS